MLNINYIKEAFESYFNVKIDLPFAKSDLVKKYDDREVISFDYQSEGITSNAHYVFSNMLKRFHNMQYLKIKDRQAYSCFDAYRVDVDKFTYKDKKVTRVLAELFECCDTMYDVCLYMLNREELTSHYISDNDRYWFKDQLPTNIAYDMKACGPLPRAYQDNPLSMTPAIFLAWLGEQHKKACVKNSQTFHIDFRSLPSLIAGNGKGFQSCYGIECFPHKEGHCYNSSPSAYAMAQQTAILYSIADDGKSLTGRAWIYFTPDSSLYFGRLYGDTMTKDVCIQAAKLLGFDADCPTYEPFSVYNIATGDAYLNDMLSIGFGPCTDDGDKIGLYCTCISCGDSINNDTDCLCRSCASNTEYCAHCGQYEVSDGDSIYVEGIGLCCDSCATHCYDCEEGHLKEDMTDVGNYRTRYICESCLENYTWVECCDEWQHRNNTYYVESEDRQVCSCCYHEHYADCIECNEVCNKDDMSTCSDCGSYVCSDCLHVCESCGNVYCSECIEEDECSSCAETCKVEEE